MNIHCTQKLAAKLLEVSATPLEETSPLGSWHAHLHHIDRRQCVFFCHDATRYVLFLPGLKKEQFMELGRWHKELFIACLAYDGIPDAQVRRAELVLGPVRFDTATDRSVQSSMRVAMWDLLAHIERIPNVMLGNPLSMNAHVNERPATVRGKLVWPREDMAKQIASLR
jgi:hypothetical protein